ncbi:protein REPRESSOR OF SILENCING 3 isoform X2 [Malania oleifera]|uniref:protein REPRESSOR OF SILENCING 3 isoform X2 n=1 Tax=Malania oleifera TaxID=397392 RepID=UPI0025AE2D71|nr:protein REPRESSOR OF SILENCING 3 isoform X2 [Malania oleifera]
MEGEEMHGSSENNIEEGGVTRIFVGGLGGAVTEDDIRKTFSSLGRIKDVDILRTKGRSFAYMDFYASSQAALAKLFSMYNGCVWKGGRLKLEKAKEHYLVRLRREWAEDATTSIAASNDIDEEKNIITSERPKNVQKTEKDLKIFFPKLKKVKSLPFNGTGKHKYSFQRIEVPALPIHFCDCEEHNDSSFVASGKHVLDSEAQCGGMNEEEIVMMESVMNKLFERESIAKDAAGGSGLPTEVDNSIKSINDALVDENGADETLDDNLIINIVTGGNNGQALFRSQEQEMISANQGFTERQTFKDKKTEKMNNSRERKIAPANKKRKLQLDEPESVVQQSSTNLSSSRKSSWRELINSDSKFSISNLLPSVIPTVEEQCKMEDLNVPTGAPTKEEECKMDNLNVLDAADSKNESAVTHTSLEDQPTEMVELAEAVSTKPNEPVNKSGIDFGKEALPTPSGMEVANSTDGKNSDHKQNISQSARGDFTALALVEEGLLEAPMCSKMVDLEEEVNKSGMHPGQCTLEKTAPTLTGNDAVSAPLVEKKHYRNVEHGESCIFMRSAASMKEWARTKAALSGSLKKTKGNEK